jgi:excisionase family DNA binding protein
VNLDDLKVSRAAVVSISDAAELLGIDARTVSRAMQNGELPALRVGRRLLIPRLPFLACLGISDGGESAVEPAGTSPDEEHGAPPDDHT